MSRTVDTDFVSAAMKRIIVLWFLLLRVRIRGELQTPVQELGGKTEKEIKETGMKCNLLS